jgi:DNA modification methylase
VAITFLTGDCRDILPTLADASVQCVVTSPPYFGLRDYGTGTWEGGADVCDHKQDRRNERSFYPRNACASWTSRDVSGSYRDTCGKCGAQRVDRQIGLEPTPSGFVATLVAVFREVRRVLRDDGTVWMNLGDSYAHGSSWRDGSVFRNGRNDGRKSYEKDKPRGRDEVVSTLGNGLKPKDLLMMPARVALALQADGWWLRSDIIWAKPNPMPESCRDRPTSAHEHVFLLTKRPRYYYDADAVREEHQDINVVNGVYTNPKAIHRDPDNVPTNQGWTTNGKGGFATRHREYNAAGRNLRNVWTLATEAFSAAHFATFPTALAERCIRAGTSERGACSACGAPWIRRASRNEMSDTGADAILQMQSVPPDAAARSVRGGQTEGRRSAKAVSELRCDGASQPSFEQLSRGEGKSASLPANSSRAGSDQEAELSSGGGKSGDAGRRSEMAQEGNIEATSAGQGTTLQEDRQGTDIRSDQSESQTRPPFEGRGDILGCGVATNAATSETSVPLLQDEVLNGPSSDDRSHNTDRQGRQAQPREYRGSLQAVQLAETRQDHSSSVGWSPSCTCQGAEIVPCVVLDCFSGSGTTALVADRLQRNAVAIDLSHEYRDMAAARYQADAGLFADTGTATLDESYDRPMRDLFAYAAD